jgi:hypothetical protein
VGIAGDINTDGKLKSTLASGAPLEVASSSMVVNLNADMVDGVQGTDIYTKAEVDTMIAAIAAEVEPKHYYQTEASTDGAGAFGACETGFHMASLFEILDPSNLQYAFDMPEARTQGDSGNGPPRSTGWVRTGGHPGNTPGVPGVANCEAYTSNSENHDGTIIRLVDDWSDPLGAGGYLIPGSAWIAYAWDCGTNWRVWCVED